MLELHHALISTCSQKVRWVLAEKELDWVDRRVRLEREEHLRPEYLRLNPNGVVPTLVHEGEPIIDSSVINEYLDESFDAHPLRPASALARARMRAWRQYFDEVATPSVRYPSFNIAFVPHFQRMSDDEFRAFAEQRPLRRDFYLKMGRHGFPPDELNAALARLRQTFERMAGALADGPWLIGTQMTLADISILPTVVRLADLGLPMLWQDLPEVARWYRRMQDRPAFDATFVPGSRDLTLH